MITIYTKNTSNRLTYICNQLFHRILGCDYVITTNKDEIKGFPIWYSDECENNGIHIKPVTLLFEQDIHPQEIQLGTWENLTTLFPTESGDIPFDLLAASFFLLSRYEEYTCHKKDIHGRYPVEESIAFQNGFLTEPLVDRWILKLKDLIQQKDINQQFKLPSYRFIPTIDVDNIYAFRNHGLLQFIYCSVRDFIKGNKTLLKQRYDVVTREKKDPFFNLSMVYNLHKKRNIHPVFFFHCGTFGKHDKRSIYPSYSYLKVRKQIASEDIVGLHPSYHASQHPLFFKTEKALMLWNKNSEERPNRFHYLRFCIPETYTLLEKNGFTSDWSLCYSTQVGFRASTSHPFYFYNLKEERETTLQLYPTAVMDKTLKSDLGLNPESSLEYIMKLKEVVESVHGTFITLFHNEHITDVFAWEGWHNMYEVLLSKCKEK